MIDGSVRIRKKLALAVVLLIFATAPLVGSCGWGNNGETHDYLSQEDFMREQGRIAGYSEGLNCGQEDKNHFEETGELLHGRRPGNPDVPEAEYEKDYTDGFRDGFYKGYDEAWPEFMDFPATGMEQSEEEDLDTGLDVDIFDEYKLGFNDGRLAGYNAGFDDGAYGGKTAKPANTGMSEDYLRGFDDGWAEGYAEGYENGTEWKEIKEMSP